MRKRPFVVIFVALLSLFPPVTALTGKIPDSTHPHHQRDEFFREKIIGEWTEGTNPYGIAAFRQGGIYEAWIWVTPQKMNLLVSMKGKWWIEKGRLYNTVSELELNIDIDIDMDEVVIDEIVDITDETMTLIDDEGVRYTKTRLK